MSVSHKRLRSPVSTPFSWSPYSIFTKKAMSTANRQPQLSLPQSQQNAQQQPQLPSQQQQQTQPQPQPQLLPALASKINAQRQPMFSFSLLPTVASILQQICDVNDQRVKKIRPPTSLLRFYAIAPPTISIQEYLQRIKSFSCCSDVCYILSLIYIDRLMAVPGFVLCSLNVHRMLVTSVMLSAKFVDDVYYNNAHYARIGGVNVSEMNNLEMDFLKLINFELYVSHELFDNYQTQLQMHASHLEEQSQKPSSPVRSCSESNQQQQQQSQPQLSSSTSTSSNSSSSSSYQQQQASISLQSFAVTTPTPTTTSTEEKEKSCTPLKNLHVSLPITPTSSNNSLSSLRKNISGGGSCMLQFRRSTDDNRLHFNFSNSNNINFNNNNNNNTNNLLSFPSHSVGEWEDVDTFKNPFSSWPSPSLSFQADPIAATTGDDFIVRLELFRETSQNKTNPM